LLKTQVEITPCPFSADPSTVFSTIFLHFLGQRKFLYPHSHHGTIANTNLHIITVVFVHPGKCAKQDTGYITPLMFDVPSITSNVYPPKGAFLSDS
jgi:hypothetical protein